MPNEDGLLSPGGLIPINSSGRVGGMKHIEQKCDECEELTNVIDIINFEGFELCPKCLIYWIDLVKIDREERVRSIEKYKPNPDFDKLEDGECPKCPD